LAPPAGVEPTTYRLGVGCGGHRASSRSRRRPRASAARNGAAGRHPAGGPTGCL